MAKYSGLVGYDTQIETRPGVWTSKIVERKMRGDLLRLASSVDMGYKVGTGDKINDDVNINNRISLVADPFAYKNFSTIKYVTYLGVKWKVSGVEVQRPRLIVTLGGLWNE